MNPYSIYIHLPFCASKCAYCDFLSFDNKPELMDAYISSLCEELRFTSEGYKGRELISVFIGGGTPTLLPDSLLEKLLKTLAGNYPVGKVEFTVEANPESVNWEKLELLQKYGANRLSMGVQAFDNAVLRRIGRIHTAEKAVESYRIARATGFSNINLDLMFGLPGQSPESWEKSLDIAVSLNPKHLSCYSLMLEEGSRLAKEMMLELPGEECERKMYYTAKSILARNGFRHYEISNFAQNGHQCRHNIVYWTLGEYVSFGIGAHSYVNGLRYRNTESIEDYIAGDYGRYDIIEPTRNDLYSEFMFLGMRMIDGVKESDFKKLFTDSMFRVFGARLKKLEEAGLVTEENDSVRLTEKGIDLSNRVFAELLLD